MSRMAVDALMSGGGYLQSPVDDIESFFWVMLYATVCNNSEEYGPDDFKLLQNYKDSRETAVERLDRGWAKRRRHRQLTSTLSQSDFFIRYKNKVNSLVEVWGDDCATLQEQAEDSQTWTLCYAAAAVGGLRVILHVAVETLSSFNS